MNESDIYIERIRELAADPDSKDYLAANKYLLEEPWLKVKVGRPSKDAIAHEAEKLVFINKKIEEDFKRIMTS